MYEGRVIVPTALRQDVLEGLHTAHQGVGKMHDRFIQAVQGVGRGQETNVKLVINRPFSFCHATIQSPEYTFQMLVADYRDSQDLFYNFWFC